MKTKKKKKPAEVLDTDAWHELVKGVTQCPMYDLTALSAKAGVDVRTASIFLQTYLHYSSQAKH